MRETYIDTIKKEERKARLKNKKLFSREIDRIESVLNYEEEVLMAYFTLYNMEDRLEDKFYAMAISIIYKNINFLYSVFRLTCMGQYAAARVGFRNVYESLIILKTISITKDKALMEDWIAGKNISLKTRIFKNIEYPNSQAMKQLWEDLCKFCHGTIDANQYSLEFNYNETSANYVIIEMLLEMNYHVLEEYVADPVDKHVVDQLLDVIPVKVSFKEKRVMMSNLFEEQRKSWGEGVKEMFIDFSKVWKYK